MAGILTPPRIRGREILDDASVKPEIVVRSMRDVARANRLFGGAKSAVLELERVFRDRKTALTLLDVGTGVGDISALAREAARNHGISLRTIGVDSADELLRATRGHSDLVCSDALVLPFRDHCVDVVLCSQLLHHFSDERKIDLLRELNRVAKARVVISDLRRSWLAALGLWLTSFLLGFHSISRHDGVVSIMRGFTPAELGDYVERAVGRTPSVSKRPLFRVTTSWTPA